MEHAHNGLQINKQDSAAIIKSQIRNNQTRSQSENRH